MVRPWEGRTCGENIQLHDKNPPVQTFRKQFRKYLVLVLVYQSLCSKYFSIKALCSTSLNRQCIDFTTKICSWTWRKITDFMSSKFEMRHLQIFAPLLDELSGNSVGLEQSWFWNWSLVNLCECLIIVEWSEQNYKSTVKLYLERGINKITLRSESTIQWEIDSRNYIYIMVIMVYLFSFYFALYTVKIIHLFCRVKLKAICAIILLLTSF